MAKYTLYYGAFNRLVLNAPFMEAEMARRAATGAEFARSIAPVDEHDEHPGRYRDGIESHSGTHGGVHGDRAYGIVRATAPESRFVEYGTEHNPAHHVLGRTLDAMGR